jgi:hypothetical protein
MARVECEVTFTQAENDRGRMQDCTKATCGNCGHTTQSWGTGPGSVKRCLMLMKEECPEGESNFYVGDVDD